MTPWPARITARISLHTRISLVLTALAASLVVVLAGVWLQGARAGAHEEVAAASRVAQQWLAALAGELRDLPAAERSDRVLALVRPLGRLRANALTVFDGQGHPLYRSPPPTYKAGRAAPAWFAALLAMDLPVPVLALGELRLVLEPDGSRAIVDAWDDLCALAGWALALLVGLFMMVRRGLDRALRPLEQVMAALDRTGLGRFDTRLPVFATPELGRLALAFNGMADRLDQAVKDNVRLDSEREVIRCLSQRLEAERREIARELHDELAQGITAVRALAGAIVQRTPEQPALHGHAHSIVAVAGTMQDGVRAILHRLREPPDDDPMAALECLVDRWRRQYPEVCLNSTLTVDRGQVDPDLVRCALRVVQEGLTNVARHARADRVEVSVSAAGAGLRVCVADNGCGPAGAPPTSGCGLGLTGMAERIALIGGTLQIDAPATGGWRLVARLPRSAQVAGAAA